MTAVSIDPARLKGIRALVFDVFGTVVDWRSGLIAAFRQQLGPDIDAEAMVDAWRGHYLPTMDRIRRGQEPWSIFDTFQRASLCKVLAEHGLPDIKDSVISELALGWHRLAPWPDSVAGLNEIKRDRVIATLSNGNVSLLVDMAKRGGLPWDAVFSAEMFGHYKPDPEVYDGAVRLLGLEPSQVLMVASHVEDLAAARRRGLRTAYMHRPHENGPNAPAPPAQDPASDITVTSITELARALANG